MTTTPKIRVLVVDDVRASRELLQLLLEQDGGFEVIGWAADGIEAVIQAAALKPDLITMDIAMPRANGVEAIANIMSTLPVAIVVVSSHVQNPAMNVTFEALGAGALDVVQKPEISMLDTDSRERQHLLSTLRAMAEVKVIKRRRRVVPVEPTVVAATKAGREIELVAIGASAGGPQALEHILRLLPATYPWPIIVTQHMVVGFMAGATHWLNSRCHLTVKLAVAEEPLRAGVVYFAPDHSHLRLARTSKGSLIVKLDYGTPIGGFMPSINRMLLGVAEVCGQAAVGGVLTGMGSDGSEGLLAMSKRGAITFAQDRPSSLIFSMPKAAIDAGAAKHTLALANIAQFLSHPTDSPNA
jgi:two-component system, chemotaxis family, protein-glutamate methylesterase/glutaminase